jgi:hypothetical protein
MKTLALHHKHCSGDVRFNLSMAKPFPEPSQAIRTPDPLSMAKPFPEPILAIKTPDASEFVFAVC